MGSLVVEERISEKLERNKGEVSRESCWGASNLTEENLKGVIAGKLEVDRTLR